MAARHGSDTEIVERRLEAEIARLDAVLARTRGVGGPGATSSGSGGELADVDQHPADQATETATQAAELGEAAAVAGELEDLRAALRRLAEGTYGRCVACGRPIDPERLDALPATPYCIEDAHLAEREALRGD